MKNKKKELITPTVPMSCGVCYKCWEDPRFPDSGLCIYGGPFYYKLPDGTKEIIDKEK